VNQFLKGANSTYYSPNATVCWNNGLNLVQYDVDLLAIKWMFGDTKENTLNFTLFARNVSDVSYSCIDAGENLFVYVMFKYSQFGNSLNDFFLAGLQNLLGKVIAIQKFSD